MAMRRQALQNLADCRTRCCNPRLGGRRSRAARGREADRGNAMRAPRRHAAASPGQPHSPGLSTQLTPSPRPADPPSSEMDPRGADTTPPRRRPNQAPARRPRLLSRNENGIGGKTVAKRDADGALGEKPHYKTQLDDRSGASIIVTGNAAAAWTHPSTTRSRFRSFMMHVFASTSAVIPRRHSLRNSPE
jgi:hypothetical protein